MLTFVPMQLDVSHPDLWNKVYLDFIDNPSIYNVIYGGSGCFYANQSIITQQGVKGLKEVKQGDFVLSFNHEFKKYEQRIVLNTFEYKSYPDKLIEIKMKDGTTIKVTENHRFYWGGKYVHIKEILRIFDHGKDLENNSGI